MYSRLYLFISSIFCFVCFSHLAKEDDKPRGFVFPVSKNDTTNQYNIYTSMPEDYQTFWAVALDLGGHYMYFGCDSVSLPSYRPVPCGSNICRAAKGTGCVKCATSGRWCDSNTCGIVTYNPLINVSLAEGLGEGILTVTSTDGFKRLSRYEIPHFSYSCVGPNLLKGLSEAQLGGIGVASLARTEMSLNKQVSKAFKLPQKFALCLPHSAGAGQGDLFIGGGPYYLPPYVGDISKILSKTPLINNPVSTASVYSDGDPSYEYFINVKSIKIDGKIVSISPSLLAIDKKGYGGTKLSTMAPYTVLHSSIYEAITTEFVKKTDSMKIRRVLSMYPFGACFSSNSIANSKTGPAVPKIDLVFQNEEVHWRIHGHNSMVKVSKDVTCLAFINGGRIARTSIVLGGHQMEDNFLKFDLDSSSFGFSNSLLLHNTNCSHFRTF